MRTLSIRARVTAFMVLLMTMGLVEAGVVLHVQRETGRALDETDRTETILQHHADAVLALFSMRGAHRGAMITGDPGELAEFDRQWQAYQGGAGEMAPLPERRADEIGVLVTAFDEMRTAVGKRAAEAAAAHRHAIAVVNDGSKDRTLETMIDAFDPGNVSLNRSRASLSAAAVSSS